MPTPRAPRNLRVLPASALVLGLLVGATACGSGSGDDDGGGGQSSGSTAGATTTATSAPAVDLAALGPNQVVRYLQEALGGLGHFTGAFDGIYGPETRAALEAFQQAEGLPANGQLDDATARALAAASPEAHDDAVKALQTELAALGLYTDGIDGDYGADTAAAVKALQQEAGLPVTGQLDAPTFAALQQRYAAAVSAPAGGGSTTTSTAGSATTATTAADPGILKPGSSGPQVQALQQRLTQLGYRPGPVDGSYGSDTASAVLAFEKREGLGRDGTAGPEVLGRLQAPTGAGPRSSAAGPRVEVDLDRQVAFVLDGAGTVTTINISSGSGQEYTDPDGSTQVAYTPTGDFSVYEKDDGNVEAPLGTLYKPLYFKEGWAMHGSPSVPAYPASHGCVRVSDDDQDFVFPLIPVGGQISVYGTSLGDPSRGAPGF